MNNEQILGDLALDLKRVALGFHRGSHSMAERFFKEALKRRAEIDMEKVAPYLAELLKNLDKIKKDKQRTAEDALMYSTIFQNASQRYISQ